MAGDETNPKGDKEQSIIDRLIAEQTHSAKIFDEIKLIMSLDQEFDGLSLVGGVKAILRRFHEEEEKVKKLKKEISDLIHKQRGRY